MKPVLSALCILALIPVATPASEGLAAEKSPQARCLKQTAARSADDAAAAFRLRMLEAARLGASSVHLSSRELSDHLNRVSASSRIDPGAGALICERLSDTPQATAARTDQPRRVRAARGGVIWKVK